MDDTEDVVFSDQQTKSRDTASDEKLSLFGFHKVAEPPHRVTRTEHHAISSGRTIFDSRTHDGGKQTGSLKKDDGSITNSVSKKGLSPVHHEPDTRGRHSSSGDEGSKNQTKLCSVETLERLTSPKVKGGFRAWSWVSIIMRGGVFCGQPLCWFMFCMCQSIDTLTLIKGCTLRENM